MIERDQIKGKGKYKCKVRQANLPLINESDEAGDETARLGSVATGGLSLPRFPKLALRPKTWTVPLSLETASHWAFEENASYVFLLYPHPS